jgi:RHS repeat-associated protein
MRRTTLRETSSSRGIAAYRVGALTRWWPSRRTGRVSLGLLVGLALSGLGFSGTGSLLRSPLPTAATTSNETKAAARVLPGDTVVIWGPQQFNGSNGQGQTYVERFTATVSTGRLYTLHLVNGTANGTQRASKVIITFNGYEIVHQNEVTQSVATLDRPIALTDVDTIRVTVAGSGNPFVTLSVLSTPEPEFAVYGPTQFLIPSGSTKTFTASFPKSSAAVAPYRVYVTNGAPNGTQRVTSGSITLNGTQVVTTSELKNTVGSLTKTVTLNTANSVSVTVNGAVNSFITVRFTATDGINPVVTITSPAVGAAVSTSSVSVTGTLQEQTPTTVTVNGVAATVTNNTSYSATVPLATEGSNLLTVQATDAAAHTSTVTRTVIRDTQAPVLTVNSPADGAVTGGTTINVSGTVSDATTTTVNTNGTPLTVTNGTFAGDVPLSPGQNVLTTSATDLAGNTTAVVRTVTRDATPPVLTVTSPVGGDTVATDSVLVAGTVTDASAVTVGANGLNLPVTGGAFSRQVPVGIGSNVITVTATDASANATTVTRSVFRSGDIPPDPSTVAPPIDPGAATVMADAVAFLYSGANPIQTGVASGTIHPTEVAVLKGRVQDRTGQPVIGATVSVLGHPEFGSTYSRADGGYDLAVNGGNPLTLNVTKFGYLQLQRSTEPQQQTFQRIEDVVLIQEDPNVTLVDFSAPTQVARGSTQTDASGTRRQVLVFKQGTQATMKLPDGSTQPLGAIHVRATEYTVGSTGPAAMAATLPANSGYTYAVEFSVDEARAVGATSVTFSQPVATYVDNFLGFPVGMKVPAGTYDPAGGRWLPENDGRVIKLLSVTGGLANLDVTGDGVPSDAATLTALGINDPERARIATEYPVGKTFWRVEMTHFSVMDGNWPFGPIANALRPLIKALFDAFDPTKKPNCTPNSIIGCESQSLGEELGVAGTPFTLAYRSERQAGRASNRSLRIPVTGQTVPASLLRVELEVHVAGQVFRTTLPSTANQVYVYTWDGKDGYGRTVQGLQRVHVRVGYAYPAVYQEPAQYAQSFAQFSGFATTIPSRQEIVLWQDLETTIGAFDAAGMGLGGWTLSAHHFYDPSRGVLYLGNGERRDANAINGTITTFAGIPGQAGFSGDGGPATSAKFNLPGGVAVGPDGSVYVSDFNNMRIRRVSPSGIITTVAGNGNPGFSGEGVLAPQAAIGNPQRLAVGPDGSIFFGPYAIPRVLKVGTDGRVHTVAGNGVFGYTGDGGPATNARIGNFAREVLPAPDGGFSFADWDFSVVRRVDGNGRITTIAGTGGSQADGVSATQAQLAQPEALSYAPDGSLYILDTGHLKLRRVGLNGIINSVWGTGGYGGAGDGGQGVQAQMTNGQGLDVLPDGTVFLADPDVCRVRRLSTDGIVTTIAGSTCGYSGDGGPATQAKMTVAFDVAAAPDGSFYVVDRDNHVIRRVAPAFPGFSATDIAIASEDGAQIYQFSATGRHLRTRDATTGAVLLTFGYDAAGRLVTVTDADNNVTTIERDGQGHLTGILAPFGQHTTIALDPAGYIATVSDPAGNLIRLFHSHGGLLDSLFDPRGYKHRYTYDNIGRLRRDDDPANGFKTLTTIDGDTSVRVTLSTALNRTTAFQFDRLPDGSFLRRITDPVGLVTISKDSSDGTSRRTHPDGTITTGRSTGDTRFGMQAPVMTSGTVRLPSGLTATVAAGRKPTLATPGDPLSLTSLVDSVMLNGKKYKTVYNAADRRFTNTSPTGRQSFTTVDAIGRLKVQRTPGIDSVIYTYDNRGRLGQQQVGGRTWTYSYDTRGRLLSSLDPIGRRDSLFYDDADRLLRRVLPGGREVSFAYDSSGNLTGVTPPGRPAHSFSYTAVDQTGTYTPPAAGLPTPETNYTYNLDKQLTQISRPDGITLGFGYEAATGRPSTATFDRGQLSFGYDATTGRLNAITAPGSLTLAYSYDGELPTSVTWGGAVSGNVGVTYNSDFRIAAQTVNTGGSSLTFNYDADGLLTTAGALGIKRNAQHGMVERDSVGNVLAVRGYDAKGAIANLTTSRSGTALFQASYTRDSLSRITSLTETVGGTSITSGFTYDSAGRLFEVRRDGVLTATYEYDLNGNRTRLTTPGGVITGTVDDQDRLTQYGTTAYTYGANGELKTQTEPGIGTTSYTYDALGNLVAATLPDGTAITYLIDGRNRRIGKKVNGTLVQGLLYQSQLAPVAELDGSNQVVSRFVYGTRTNVPDYMLKGGATYRLISDHLGSVRLVVNAADGAVAQRLDYDEYGRVTQNTAPGFQPFGFAGGLLDTHTGLTRFGARDYDARTGRWTAKDPLGFGGGGGNLYSYVKNDPVNSSDPSGRVPLIIVTGAIGGVLGFVDAYRVYGWDWAELGAGTAGGIVGGIIPGIGAGKLLRQPLNDFLRGATAGALSNYISQKSRVDKVCRGSIDPWEMVKAAASGGAGAALGNALGQGFNSPGLNLPSAVVDLIETIGASSIAGILDLAF